MMQWKYLVTAAVAVVALSILSPAVAQPPDTTVGDDPPELPTTVETPDLPDGEPPTRELEEQRRRDRIDERREQDRLRREGRLRTAPDGTSGGVSTVARPDARVLTFDVTPEGELQLSGEPGTEPGEAVLALSLEDAIELALQRNLGLKIERIDRRQAQLQLLGEKGIFDLRLGGQIDVNDLQNPTFDQLVSSSSERQLFNLGVAQLLPWGGDANVGLTGVRSERSSSDINPFFNGDVNFGYDQPLLRDFGRLPTERGIRLAQVDSSISLADLEAQISQTILDVHNAYWALIDAEEQLIVARQARELAVELDDRNRIEVEVGTRAPLELVQSEATIALRDEDIITSETFLGDAEDVLRQLLNLPPDLWRVPIRPTTEAETASTRIELEEAFRTAIAERPELAVQRLLLERADIDADFFRNQALPRLDLSLGYGFAGLDARGQIPGPDGGIQTLDGTILDALDEALGGNSPSWTANLTFAYPLQNRTARAAREIAELSREQVEVQLEDLEQSVLTEVRSAVRQVNSASQQIRSARVSRNLQERNLEAEQKRYENGMSTSFQVSEIQDDLTQARSREVSALTNYRLALARYHQAVGRLVEEAGVEMVDPVGSPVEVDDGPMDDEPMEMETEMETMEIEEAGGEGR
jgi:outer membrane protein